MAQPANRPVFAPWLDPNEKPLICFQNVTKKFGEFVAIDNLTLDIFRREFFALLGPSLAIKSKKSNERKTERKKERE